MSGDGQDSAGRHRAGELLLQVNVAPPASPKRQSNLLEVLERRTQPRRSQSQSQGQSQGQDQGQARRPKDVKARLVSQWKQTLALSSVTARKLVTEPTPAPKAKVRRSPPKPPNPLRTPGRTEVNRIRREAAEKAAIQAAAQAAIQAAPKAETQVAAQTAAQTATPPIHAPEPSRWIPTLPSLTARIAETAVQTAGTLLLVLAVKAGTALAKIGT